MLIAHVSDTHITVEGRLPYRRVETSTFLARCVEHLAGLRPRPDLVLATGDLVDRGQPEEYARFRRLISPLRMPVYLLPGNHDARGALTAAFPDHEYLPRDGRFLQYVVERDGLRLLALDTLVEGEHVGELCDERLEWLCARLAEGSGRPTVLVMHHPPFRTGIEYMDRYGLRHPERLAAIVRDHPEIEAIVAGHLHRRIHVRWAGTVATTAPSPAHQVALDLGPAEMGRFTYEPPAILVHLWRPDQGLITHSSYIGGYPGPFPFRESR